MSKNVYHAGTVSVDVITQLKESKNSFKNYIDNFKDQVSNINLSTKFGKNAEKALNYIENKLNELESIDLDSKLFNTKDLVHYQRVVTQIGNKIATIGVQGSRSFVKDWNFIKEEDLNKLQQMENGFQDLQRQMVNFRKSLASAFISSDQIKDLEELRRLAREGANFKESSSSVDNKKFLAEQRATLEERKRIAAENVQQETQKYNEMVQAASKVESSLRKAAEAANNTFEAAENKVESLNEKAASLEDLKLFKDVKGFGTKGRNIDSIIKEYQDIISKQLVNGQFKEGGKAFIQAIGQMLQVPPSELEGAADKVVETLNQKLAESLKDSQNKNHLKEFRDILKNSLPDDYFDIEKINLEKEDAQKILLEAERKASEAKANLTNFLSNSEIDRTGLDGYIQDAAEIEKQLNAVIKSLEIIERFDGGEKSEYFQKLKADIDRVQAEIAEFKQSLVDTASAPLVDLSKSFNDQARQVGQVVSQDAYAKQLLAQQDAERLRIESDAEMLRNNMKESLTRWISVQSIINTVKQGIRQAWQDIQNLDKAMTNIAVVTDMSISDLWGRIDEYMSIAQQYGVTTQGVYEVSQLYYQQGLGTADVMEATTETLKLARQ